MPRAPISSGAPLAAATARRNIFAGEQVGRSLSYLGASIGRTAEIAQNEQDNRVLLEARTHVSRAMNDAQIAAEDPATDPAEMLTGFDRSVTQAREDALHGVLGGDQRLGRALDAQTQDAIEARRLGIGRLQGRRLQQASVAALEDHLDESARSIATTKDPLDAKATYAEAESAIEASSLDPVAKERARHRFSRGVDLNTARGLLAGDPQGVLALTADPERFMQAFPGLQPEDRFTLATSANVELNRRETAYREAKRDAEEASMSRWLDRIYGVDPEHLPTVQDVVADDSLGKQKAQVVRLLEQRAKGAGSGKSESLENELYVRIHDESDPNHITDARELTPYVERIGAAAARRLTNDILLLRKDPEAKRQDQQLTAFLAGARRQIVSSTLMRNDPTGERKNSEFVYEARKRWDAERAAGHDPVKTLLDPESPTALQKLIPQFRPGPYESDKLDELRKAKAAASAPKAQDMGKRADGTQKDTGFLGRIPIDFGPQGAGVATEFSVPINEGLPDEEARKLPAGDMPTLVPTLTKAEIEQMRTDIIPNRKPIPKAIMEKARAHALARIAEGKSPFFNSREEPPPPRADGESPDDYLKRVGP